ncbi:uncharacterized protein LOC114257821 [Camellia sinensis]|uniref:uncharacterized protein LOC114257821 n=1 Tax=Camellia sinensis TaxID=4442 RepID=UPI001036F1D8|nr:uncharacterized protein LOC114257821 [Camellia sinensis]
MGTREVYEEKLSFGNLYHDPTMNPGLGLPRCHRCLSLLNPNADNGEWTITSVLHDATVVISYLILIYMLALELAECLVQFMVSIQGSCISKNMLKDQMASFTYWGVDYVLCTSGVPLFLFCLLLRPQSANPCASCRKVLYTIPSESEIDLQGLVAKEKLN